MPTLLTLGQPQHPALVFLHGFLGRGASWLPIARPLSKRFYCLLPDLPGHGANTADPFASPITFDALADWLCQLLDAQRLERVHLLGYSLGGRIALHFACRHPQRLLSLALEGASPGLQDETERARRRAEDDTRAASMVQHGMAAFVETWYDMPLFASLRQHPRKLAAIKTAASQNDPQWMSRIIRDLSPGRQTPLWDCLPHLTLPTLLMAGALDSKYAQLIAVMAAHMPQAHTRLIADAGHNAHAEQPRAVQAALCQFYRLAAPPP